MQPEAPRPSRVLELLAALILGLATVATAWCAYQSARWNDRETDETRDAAAFRLTASRLYNLGSQKVSYDATIAALYAQAVVNGDDDLVRFYDENLVRPAFIPIIREWQAAIAAGEPLTNLFENEAYLDEQFSESYDQDALSEAAAERGQEASDNAQAFLRATIFLASSLFFAGVTANFHARSVRLFLVLIAVLMFAIGIALIADYPVA